MSGDEKRSHRVFDEASMKAFAESATNFGAWKPRAEEDPPEVLQWVEGYAIGGGAERPLIQIRCRCRKPGPLLAVVYQEFYWESPVTVRGVGGPPRRSDRIVARRWRGNKTNVVYLSDLDSECLRLACPRCRLPRVSPPAKELLEVATAKILDCETSGTVRRVATLVVDA